MITTGLTEIHKDLIREKENKRECRREERREENSTREKATEKGGQEVLTCNQCALKVIISASTLNERRQWQH